MSDYNIFLVDSRHWSQGHFFAGRRCFVTGCCRRCLRRRSSLILGSILSDGLTSTTTLLSVSSTSFSEGKSGNVQFYVFFYNIIPSQLVLRDVTLALIFLIKYNYEYSSCQKISVCNKALNNVTVVHTNNNKQSNVYSLCIIFIRKIVYSIILLTSSF